MFDKRTILPYTVRIFDSTDEVLSLPAIPSLRKLPGSLPSHINPAAYPYLVVPVF